MPVEIEVEDGERFASVRPHLPTINITVAEYLCLKTQAQLAHRHLIDARRWRFVSEQARVVSPGGLGRAAWVEYTVPGATATLKTYESRAKSLTGAVDGALKHIVREQMLRQGDVEVDADLLAQRFAAPEAGEAA